MCQLMGIARNATTSYHPHHNGNIERMHRSLNTRCVSRLLRRPNWLAELPWVLLGLRGAANLETGCLHHCWVPVSNPLCQASWLLWHDKMKSRTRDPDDLWTEKRVLVRADKVKPITCAQIHGSLPCTTPMEEVF